MKLSKFSALVKKYGKCNVIGTKTGDIWLGVPAAVYRGYYLPDIQDALQAGAILDIKEKDLRAISFERIEAENKCNILGMNLRADDPTEQQVKKLKMRARSAEVEVVCLQSEDGNLLFYDPKLLEPLADVKKNSEYFDLTVRTSGYGGRYIAVKDGFDVIAAVLPLKVITEEFLQQLSEFESLCAAQYERELTQPKPE